MDREFLIPVGFFIFGLLLILHGIFTIWRRKSKDKNYILPSWFEEHDDYLKFYEEWTPYFEIPSGIFFIVIVILFHFMTQ